MDIHDFKGWWLIDGTIKEMKDFIEVEPYSKDTDLFLSWLLQELEGMEEFERCSIVADEIKYRRDLMHRLESNNFFD